MVYLSWRLEGMKSSSAFAYGKRLRRHLKCHTRWEHAVTQNSSLTLVTRKDRAKDGHATWQRISRASPFFLSHRLFFLFFFLPSLFDDPWSFVQAFDTKRDHLSIDNEIFTQYTYIFQCVTFFPCQPPRNLFPFIC